jgi:glycosyltransferase involved in cell wall biosynthesis
MHCNLAELISQNSLIFRCAEAVQRFMVRKADAVVAFYPLLLATVKQMAPRTPTYLILPPAVDEGLPEPTEEGITRLRRELRLTGGPVLLYTGTLENYQGLHLLLMGAHKVKAQFPEVRYLIVGGKPHQAQRLRTLAQQLGVNDYVQIIGSRPLSEMPCFMALADILLSPRNQANHVPLKLYSYLHSGKPILATNILSHTQILTPQIAKLVPPTPEALAQGLLDLLHDPLKAKAMGEYGKQYASEHYSWSTFVKKCHAVYHAFTSDPVQEPSYRDHQLSSPAEPALSRPLPTPAANRPPSSAGTDLSRPLPIPSANRPLRL